MYYNNNDKILINRLPKNILRQDGSLFINFDQSDIETLSDFGFYTIRNDNSTPPDINYIEDITQRTIVLDKPYVDINRVWIDNSPNDQLSPAINNHDVENIQIHKEE